MSTTFSVTRDEVVRAALRKVGAAGEGQNPSAQAMQDATEALNMLVKHWQSKGLNMWTRTEAVLFFALNKQYYSFGAGSTDMVCNTASLIETTLAADAATGAATLTLADASSIVDGMNIGVLASTTSLPWTTVVGAPVGNVVTLTVPLPVDAATGVKVFAFPPLASIPRPLAIVSARRRSSEGIDVPLIENVREQYFSLPSKSSQGPVNTYYYDPQIGAGMLYVWPVANNLSDQLRFTYQRPISDLNAAGDVPEYPQEWYRALVYGLAYDLTMDYGVVGEQSQKLQLEAKQSFNDLEGFDTDVATYIRPVFDVRSA